MYKVDTEKYAKNWEEISTFIKYGCLKDDKFREKMSDYIIFKDLNDKYITLPEYVDAVKADEDGDAKTEDADKENTQENKDGDKEEEPTTVYYVTDMQQQSQYVNMFKEQNINAVILNHNIDQAFISQLEQGDLKVSFKRIDAGLNDTMKDDADEETLKKETEELSEIFKKALGKDKLEVKVEKLKNDSVSSMLTLSEETRRMQDMMKMYSAGGMGMDMFGDSETLVLNSSNKLVQYILNNKEAENVDMFCKQLYDLAVLANHPLKAEEMTEFVNRSNEIMLLLAK